MKKQEQDLINYLQLENNGYEEFTPEGLERGIYGTAFGKNFINGDIKIVIYADTDGLYSYTYSPKITEKRLWKTDGTEYTFEILL